MKLKETKGITLIALVVTIIILIILATISIYAVLGENGIIASANRGKLEHRAAEVQEEVLTWKVMKKLAEYDENIHVLSRPDFIQDQWERGLLTDEEKQDADDDGIVQIGSQTINYGDDETITPPPEEPTKNAIAQEYGRKQTTNKTVKDNSTDEKAITIPTGYSVVDPSQDSTVDYADDNNPKVDEGIVIQDDAGNQFVWIPVLSETDFTRTNFDNEGKATNSPPTNEFDEFATYLEPFERGYENEVLDYNTMKTQVLAWKGFYIGRYEAGIDTTTLRDALTRNPSFTEAVVVKKGVAPYNFTIGEAPEFGDEGISEIVVGGAINLAKNRYEDNPGSVTSTLVYGSQWDAMCRFIGDADRTGPRGQSAAHLTGSFDDDVSKNIYDLAGNCHEWTMEIIDVFGWTDRVFRGGNGSDPTPIYERCGRIGRGILRWVPSCTLYNRRS